MAAAPDLTLWGVGTSRTIRAHWAMHELALPYKTMPIGPRTGETKTAEYTKLNPRQKVPLLQDLIAMTSEVKRTGANGAGRDRRRS